MALKQGKPLQQRLKTTKKSYTETKAPGDDPWAFLGHIDAPQWADLSVEAGLMEGDDPWFHVSHKHHQISLAYLNYKTSGLQPGSSSEGKSFQANKKTGTFSSKHSVKGCREKGVSDSRGQLNRPGQGQSWPRSQIKRIQLQKDSSSLKKSIDRFSIAQGLQCTSSGSSCNSDCEQQEPQKSSLPCSDSLSVSSVRQNISSNLLSSVPRETLSPDSAETSSGTPTRCDSQSTAGQNNRNCSEALFCASRSKTRFSYELCLSKSTGSSSTVQRIGNAVDLRSSSHSLATAPLLSTSGRLSAGRRCKSWEATNDARKVDKESETQNEVPSRESAAGSNTLNRYFIQCQGAARRVVKDESLSVVHRIQTKDSSIQANKLGKQLDKRGSHIGTESGKGNVVSVGQQLKAKTQNRVVLSTLECPPGCLRSNIAGGRQGSVKLEYSDALKPGVDSVRLQPDTEKRRLTRESRECVAQVTSVSISQKLKQVGLSKIVLGHKQRTGEQPEDTHGSMHENTGNSEYGEQDLVALVAQHNHKIRTLGTHDLKKGWK